MMGSNAGRLDCRDIAIVGIGCRYPDGCDEAEKLWDYVRAGSNATRDIPSDRWVADEWYDSRPLTAGKMVTKRGAFLPKVYDFDAGFFNIGRSEAELMDPQQRLALQVCWEAIEDAGLVLDRVPPDQCGVFIGVMTNDYSRSRIVEEGYHDLNAYHLTGNWINFVSGRIAYCFGFRGPVMSIDGACASSLITVHTACRSLRAMECEIAVVGAVSLVLSPEISVALSHAGALSADGVSRAFDAAAGGLGRGEGCGFLILKRLESAVRSGDRILAVIRGSAMNHGGSGTGLVVPNGVAQEELLRKALADAQMVPNDIDYVEAHGTGTRIGDPIEANAIGKVYGVRRDHPLYLGSVKTNIGHLDAAAGIAGLTKMVMALRHKCIPPHPFNSPSSEINWTNLNLALCNEPSLWAARGGKRRAAGVSSFGMSGMNAHVIVEEWVEPVRASAEPAIVATELTHHALVISARSEPALRALAGRYADVVGRTGPTDIPNLLANAISRRNQHACSLVVVAEDRNGLEGALEDFSVGRKSAKCIHGIARSSDASELAAVFTGLGGLWDGVGRELIERFGAFSEAVDACDAIMLPRLGWSVKERMCEGADIASQHADVTQPIVFAIHVGLATLWASWGVRPSIVIGHSLGEIAAAHVAGALSLEDAALVVCERSRLVRQLGGEGGMVAVGLPESQLSERLEKHEEIEIAAHNSPVACVVSGRQAPLDAFVADLEGDGIAFTRLSARQANHSRQLDPVQKPLADALRGIRPMAGHATIVSARDGTIVRGESLNGEYWTRHVREPVRFAQGIKAILDEGVRRFLEIGPHAVLANHVLSCADNAGIRVNVASSMSRRTSGERTMLHAAATLHVSGATMPWARLVGVPCAHADLPLYPWQDEFFRRESKAPTSQYVTGDDSEHPLLGTRIQVAAESDTSLWNRTLSIADTRHRHLRDHRIGDDVVFPGSAYLEMMLAAARQILGEQTFELRDVKYLQSMYLNDDFRSLQCAAKAVDGGIEFRILSRPQAAMQDAKARSKGWTLHATGVAVTVTDGFKHRGGETGAPESLKDLFLSAQLRCSERFDGTEHVRRMQLRRTHYGPSYQAIQQVFRRDGEAVVRAAMPIELDRGRYGFHPALLDGWIQVAAAALPFPSDETFVPVGAEVVRVHEAEFQEDVWVHVTLSSRDGEGKADIQVVNEEHGLILEVCGLRVARVDTQGRPLENRFHEIKWTESSRLADAEDRTPSPYLVLGDEALGAGIARKLCDAGRCAVLAIPTKGKGTNGTTVKNFDPIKPESMQELLQEFAGGELTIIHVLATPTGEVDSASAVVDALDTGVASALHALQARQTAGDQHATRYVFITEGSQQVTGLQDFRQIIGAGIWGFAKVAGLESPRDSFSCVDLDPGSSLVDRVEFVVQEIVKMSPERQIMMRGSRRLVARLCAVELDRREPPGISSFGTHVIFGGIGGIGLATADWLVEHGARYLVLTGRSVTNEVEEKISQRWAELGVKAQAIRGDVTSPQDVDAVFVAISRSMPRVAGVIHAAGVLGDRMLTRVDRDNCMRVVWPKAVGMWNLAQVTQSLELDYFWLCSSVTSLLGNAGQGAYAVGNAILDAFGQQCASVGRPGLSINWGAWREVGMVADHSEVARNVSSKGHYPMGNSECFDALGTARMLSSGQLGIFKWQPSVWVAMQPGLAGDPFYSEILPTEVDSMAPVQEVRLALRSASGKNRMRELIRHVLSTVRKIARSTAHELTAEDSLDGLGLDSLMIVELKNQLESTLDIGISVGTLWSFPVIADLCRHLDTLVAGTIPQQANAGISQLSAQESALFGDLASSLVESTNQQTSTTTGATDAAR